MYSAMTTPSMANNTSIALDLDLSELRITVGFQFCMTCYREDLPLDQPTWDLCHEYAEEALIRQSEWDTLDEIYYWESGVCPACKLPYAQCEQTGCLDNVPF